MMSDYGHYWRRSSNQLSTSGSGFWCGGEAICCWGRTIEDAIGEDAIGEDIVEDGIEEEEFKEEELRWRSSSRSWSSGSSWCVSSMAEEFEAGNEKANAEGEIEEVVVIEGEIEEEGEEGEEEAKGGRKQEGIEAGLSI